MRLCLLLSLSANICLTSLQFPAQGMVLMYGRESAGSHKRHLYIDCPFTNWGSPFALISVAGSRI
jgi:hypothetical protein